LLKFEPEHEKFKAAWEQSMPEPVFYQRLTEKEAEKEAGEEERKRAKRNSFAFGTLSLDAGI
jgi:hypothetical protein